MLQNITAVVFGFVFGLFTLIISVIALIEGYVRSVLDRIGIPDQIQTALLALLLLALVVVSFRLFGKLFGVLIAIGLVALLLHALFAPPLENGGARIPGGAGSSVSL